MRVLIIGCGYTGVRLGQRLLAGGHEVHGVRRSPGAELGRMGIREIACDIGDAGQVGQLPGEYDWVVNAVSSGKGGLEAYRRVYLEGTRNLLERFADSPPAKYVHVSSTSVYGQTDGSAVNETSPAEPASPTGQVLVETEQLLLDSFRRHRFPAVIPRAAGIYGPGRGFLFQQFLRGEARMIGEGQRYLNMIHVEDLAGAILAVLEKGEAGGIYNAADDEPVREIDFFRWLAERTGRGLPPALSEESLPERKRALTSKRVSNARLKSGLQFGFRYPTFREGYEAEVKALGE